MLGLDLNGCVYVWFGDSLGLCFKNAGLGLLAFCLLCFRLIVMWRLVLADLVRSA